MSDLELFGIVLLVVVLFGLAANHGRDPEDYP